MLASKSLINLVKECLSISSTSTAKDSEINMWITACKEDLRRQGINVDFQRDSEPLIQSAIVMYVKANYGATEINQKELCLKTYNLLCNNLSLSSGYKEDNNG